METINNYLKYFKDVPFSESPFNDVDNIIFSTLVYLDFEKLINKPIKLKDLGKKYFNNIDYRELKKSPIIIRRTTDNFELLFNGDRYKDIIVSDYVKFVDSEKQFCAMKFKDNSFTYIAYEGTDDSMIGWKEDFQMIYKFPVPAQKMAIDYLNRVAKFSDKKIIVGGHSKGGNLAMTASMYAKSYIRKKIVRVYNNDGPGFRIKEYNSQAFKNMEKKLRMFVPEESAVGMLLRNTNNYKVIKSSGKGLFQHNPNNWKCYGPIFLSGTLSEDSLDVHRKIIKWLNRHDDIKRKKMVESVFDMIDKSEIKLFSELRQLRLTRLVKLIKASKDVDKESKDLVISAIKVLLFKDDDLSE
ncbi:MAG: DUF2974 domain-containing protein [Bacilli bacterium]|nr:DUF2974 domain-containing protein [Bacilli bacterium]